MASNFLAEAARRFHDDPPLYVFPKSLVRFFLPLPDPLPTPDGFVSIRTYPMTPRDLEEKEAAGIAVRIPSSMWIESLRQDDANGQSVDNLSPAVPPVENGSSGGTGISMPIRGIQQFLGVVRLWNGAFDSMSVLSHLEPSLEAAARAGAIPSREMRKESEPPRHPGMRVDYTVAEVVVPLFDQEMASGVDPWGRSLDVAISLANRVIQAVYLVRKELPFKAVARAHLPPLIPYWLGDVDASLLHQPKFPVAEWRPALEEANEGFTFTQRPRPYFDGSACLTFGDALDKLAENSPFTE